MYKKLTGLVLALLLVVSFAYGCGGNGGSQSETDTSGYTLSAQALSIEIGDRAQLSVIGKNVDASAVEWESGNHLKASVQGGLVTGVSEGRTLIIARYGGSELYCVVTVLPINTAVPVLTLDTEDLIMLKGSQANRVAFVKYDGNPVSAEITYFSSDENVVTVDGGIITARGVGTATVTVTSSYKNVNLYETIEVSVNDFLILFDEYEFTLGLNQSKVLEGKLWTVDNGIVSGAAFTYGLNDESDSSYVNIDGATITVTALPSEDKTVGIIVNCSAGSKVYTDLLQLKIAG